MPASQIFGCHFFFVVEGASSSQTQRPSFASGDEVGYVTEMNIEPVIEEREIWAPNTGRLYRMDVREFKRAHNVSVTVEQTSATFWRTLLNTLSLTAGSNVQYNPNEGTTLRGWSQFQFYDDTNTLINTLAIWSRLKIAPVRFGPELTRGEFQVMELYSSQNNGTFATLA
jgi:hypothetical protein